MRISSLTSSKRRPMKRLIEKTVFSGLVTAWRLATWPTRRSPDLAKPTTDGRDAAAFGVRDDDGFAALHHRDDGVGRAQVDANDFAHSDVSLPRSLANNTGSIKPER